MPVDRGAANDERQRRALQKLGDTAGAGGPQGPQGPQGPRGAAGLGAGGLGAAGDRLRFMSPINLITPAGTDQISFEMRSVSQQVLIKRIMFYSSTDASTATAASKVSIAKFGGEGDMTATRTLTQVGAPVCLQNRKRQSTVRFWTIPAGGTSFPQLTRMEENAVVGCTPLRVSKYSMGILNWQADPDDPDSFIMLLQPGEGMCLTSVGFTAAGGHKMSGFIEWEE